MTEGHEIPYLREVLVFLLASVFLVPLFRRLGTSPILVYLAIGAIVGPFGLGFVEDAEGVRRLAELGVVFLLFTIGLELSMERLWSLRRYVFGFGALQVLISAVAIALVAWAWGNSPAAAILVGAALALSSTAFVTQLLIERAELASPVGRPTFAVLLFQDLAVVPILFMVAIFGQAEAKGGAEPLALGLMIALGRAGLALLVIVLLGRLLLRPLFHLVAGRHSPELFMAMTLLVIIGTAWATDQAGLSMASGAFLAGLLLAETEFRHQVESDIQPFKGLLLGLFFISVGMAIDFAAVADRAFWVIASVLGLMLLKAAIASALGLAFRLPPAIALRCGLLLSQGGEFAFVIVGAAMLAGLIPPAVAQFMVIVAGLTMVMTPPVAALARRLSEALAARDSERSSGHLATETEGLEGHVIIAGYGRVGQTVARFLDAQKVPYVALDLDPARVLASRERGQPVHFGNACRHDVLERFGAERAASMVITLDDFRAAGKLLAIARSAWPELQTFVRARDRSHAADLLARGATLVVPETVESSLQLAGQVLQAVGTPRDAVNQLIDQTREAELLPQRAPAARAVADS
ncbi:MAG: monovalent cation:proton antiporter-2 (CPA2) family protein [Kiloniellales bacterium]|nr:monovalent cation:proton antiporter-2 (CPA2) family protein [Kiloniellales bacterium]